MDNKEIFRRYQAALRRPDTLAPLLAPDFIAYDRPPPNGRDELIDFRRAVMAAFPDQTFEIMDILAENDRVAARLQTDQTHHGAFQGIPPTGRRFSFEVYEIVHIKDGLIAARWTSMQRAVGDILAELAAKTP
jgi:predicted ester cyclase